MARTAITVTSVPAWLAGADLTATTGDAANDHTVDMSSSPRLILLALNTNVATVACSVEVPANSSTYQNAHSISHTLPAAVAGIPGVRVIPIDSPSIAQAGNVLHVDSADANFGDVRFFAFTWAPTPR
jgi:hypothetical protein